MTKDHFTMLENLLKGFDPKEVIADFEAMTKNAERVQRETLKNILRMNGRTEYFQKYGLNEFSIDPENFKARIPLVEHEDLECYIKRIADGDDSPILTQKPIKAMSISSGTSKGKPKLVPYNEEMMAAAVQVISTSLAFSNCSFPVENGKYLQLSCTSKQFKTDGGLLVSSVSTYIFRDPLFRKTVAAMRISPCSPLEVIVGSDYQQSLYCHLLSGLIFEDEIQVITSTFAHSLVDGFRSFEQYWEEFCVDITNGILSNRISDPSMRTAMSKILKPNPEKAEKIYNKCKGLSGWNGLIPTLFPNAKYIYTVMTGSMEPYVRKLRHYAGEKLPLVSTDYGSSESWIGANINPKLPPEQVTYAVLPNVAYFEFIPLQQSLNQEDFSIEPKPVGLTEVEVGEEYEIVLTTFTGLYRYKLGDVVKVKGFHNSTPELQFLRRKNLVLTIDVDKTTEKDLQLAVEAASDILVEEKKEVMDYTSSVDSSTEPSHYVIFWELSEEASDEVLQACCDCLDRSILNLGYVVSREAKTIGALELRVVKAETFHHILNHYVGLGAGVTQFKTPRCVGQVNHKVLQILSANVVKTYFSAAYN